MQVLGVERTTAQTHLFNRNRALLTATSELFFYLYRLLNLNAILDYSSKTP